MTTRKSLSLFLNELWIIILSGVILGAFIYEIFERQLPCPLCFLQRVGMIATAIGPLLNLLYGIRASHYALAMAGALFGASVSIRQILLHICPGFPSFGLPIFGFELYTWAFFVALSSLVGTVFLLFLYQSSSEYQSRAPLRPLGYSAIVFLSLMIAANVISSFLECGFDFCPDNPK